MAFADWLLSASALFAIMALVTVSAARARERSRADALRGALIRGARPVNGYVDFDRLSELPPPVARYFRHVLTEGQEMIRTARFRQSGVLRSSHSSSRWFSFNARQLVVPTAPGFLWNARVNLPFAAHLRVLDSYSGGGAAGRISLCSTVVVASAAGAPELDSGALHRYLAESVWFPTALLPQSGVLWMPIDEHSALATLTDGGTTVALEFRFNAAGEIIAIYSPQRFGRFDGGYRQLPWQGHFRDYQEHCGMRIPSYGEVGWHIDGALQLVWKGTLTDPRYELGPGTNVPRDGPSQY